MSGKVACIFVACLVAVNAGLIPVPSAKYLEGPSTKTKVVGPDGSIIDAYAPGGRILLEDNAGPVFQAAPVVYAHPAISGFEYQQLVVPEAASNAVEAVVPVASAQDATADSITVESRKITSDGEERVFLHPGTPPRVETRESVPIKEETEETTSGTTETPATTEFLENSTADLSGTYIPDNFEKFFDDGSYRPEFY
ncbi:uncharacterized protein LOC115890304 [Sitophilus oryzae]|uniref:Uncharacterized protein LOC115890304 n=1 Tax=Sitophilus oryzae TaxID=7048 RepID=A0A6J2YSX3_SITOR|nr:uncharacterized protein LOC115890304 [Sitophilus oryzae]